MKKIINIVLFLLSLTLVSCGTITSGTSTTKIVSSDPFSVDIRVYTDFDRSNILTELLKADKLAALHVRLLNKMSLPYDTDNSFFKTINIE